MNKNDESTSSSDNPIIAIGWVIYNKKDKDKICYLTREFHMPETDTEKKVVDIKERTK